MSSTASASSGTQSMPRSPQQQRLSRRVLRHHLVLALVSAALLGILAALSRANDWHLRWSIATAYTSLVLLCVTLLIGPWNVLRARPNPVSTDLRRDIGIWSALLGCVHVIVALSVYGLTIRRAIIRVVEASGQRIPRVEWLVLANDLGLIATVILVFLLALSNDRSLRALRPERWKALQRWNYGLFGLVALHAIMFQVLEHRSLLFVISCGILLALVVIMQLAGVWWRIRRVKR